jgi:hypothetical protein
MVAMSLTDDMMTSALVRSSARILMFSASGLAMRVLVEESEVVARGGGAAAGEGNAGGEGAADGLGTTGLGGLRGGGGTALAAGVLHRIDDLLQTRLDVLRLGEFDLAEMRLFAFDDGLVNVVDHFHDAIYVFHRIGQLDGVDAFVNLDFRSGADEALHDVLRFGGVNVFEGDDDGDVASVFRLRNEFAAVVGEQSFNAFGAQFGRRDDYQEFVAFFSKRNSVVVERSFDCFEVFIVGERIFGGGAQGDCGCGETGHENQGAFGAQGVFHDDQINGGFLEVEAVGAVVVWEERDGAGGVGLCHGAACRGGARRAGRNGDGRGGRVDGRARDRRANRRGRGRRRGPRNLRQRGVRRDENDD